MSHGTTTLQDQAEPEALHSLEPTAVQSADARSMHAELVRLANEDTEREAYVLELVKAAVGLTRALGGICFLRDADGRVQYGPRLLSRTLLASYPKVPALLAEEASAALRDLEPRVRNVDPGATVVALCVPVIRGDDVREVFAIVVNKGRDIEHLTAELQLLAAYVDLWETANRSSQAGREASEIAAAVEIANSCLDQPNLHEACLHFVNVLYRFVECDSVALGLLDRKERLVLKTLSGLSEFDRRAEVTKQAQAALDEALDTGEARVWDAAAHPPAGMPALHQLGVATGGSACIAAPLVTNDGETVGAVLALWRGHQQPALDRASRALEAMQPSIASAFRLRRQADGRGAPGWLAALWSRPRRRAALVAVPVLIALILCLPVHHKISAAIAVEPLAKRVVAAPFNGIIKRTTSEGGDRVRAEQTVAALDGREVRWELEALESERQRIAKQRQGSMAEGETAAAQMAALELQRIDAQQRLLQYKQDNLEIKSPMDGVIISGDLRRAQGRPVSKGDVLFEVSPLESLLIEIAVPAEDIAYVERGMEVAFQIDSLPGREWRRPLEDLQPRSVVREGENVFIGEIELANTNQQLRPGMSGTASVIGGEAALGWVVFHKLFERLGRWLGLSVGRFETSADGGGR